MGGMDGWATELMDGRLNGWINAEQKVQTVPALIPTHNPTIALPLQPPPIQFISPSGPPVMSVFFVHVFVCARVCMH